MGYDGKGQAVVAGTGEAESAWHNIGGQSGILEAFVDFAGEGFGRHRPWSPEGRWPPIRRSRTATSTISSTPRLPRQNCRPALAADADAIARTIAERLDLVGVMAVEMFVTKDGRLLVNELAPRPHNSGHWTIDACLTSQFALPARRRRSAGYRSARPSATPTP